MRLYRLRLTTTIALAYVMVHCLRRNSMDFTVEMNFCRRCGTKLAPKADLRDAYHCENDHVIFYNAGVGPCLALFNKRGEILVVERAVEARGLWDLPGGLCNVGESLEDGLAREVREEVGLEPSQYTKPEYLGSGVNSYHYGSEVVPAIAQVF